MKLALSSYQRYAKLAAKLRHELSTEIEDSSQLSYKEPQVKLANIACSDLGIWLPGFSSEDNNWLAVCFAGSVESKSPSCSSGMNRSSACLRLVFWKCRQIRHHSDRLKCCLRIYLFGVSTDTSLVLSNSGRPATQTCLPCLRSSIFLFRRVAISSSLTALILNSGTPELEIWYHWQNLRLVKVLGTRRSIKK